MKIFVHGCVLNFKEHDIIWCTN